MKNTNTEILDMLYTGTTTIETFNWDQMTTTPILNLMSPLDIEALRSIITSVRYAGNTKVRMKKINEIMNNRGFTKFAGGTNRLVYTHPLASNAVFKVAVDAIGIKDNPAEFYNQRFLKPYCTKVFECSPCGTIASFEKVDNLTSFEEFYSIADDYYYLITRKILGKYVMEDIGTNFFMNFGIRRGCYPVILDFPYLFELDGRKLTCGTRLDDGTICNGEIDYEPLFNFLECKKCGTKHMARDLAKPPKESSILIGKRGHNMKIRVIINNEVVSENTPSKEKEVSALHDFNKNSEATAPAIKGGKLGVNIRYTNLNNKREKSGNKVTAGKRSIIKRNDGFDITERDIAEAIQLTKNLPKQIEEEKIINDKNIIKPEITDKNIIPPVMEVKDAAPVQEEAESPFPLNSESDVVVKEAVAVEVETPAEEEVVASTIEADESSTKEDASTNYNQLSIEEVMMAAMKPKVTNPIPL